MELYIVDIVNNYKTKTDATRGRDLYSICISCDYYNVRIITTFLRLFHQSHDVHGFLWTMTVDGEIPSAYLMTLMVEGGPIGVVAIVYTSSCSGSSRIIFRTDL